MDRNEFIKALTDLGERQFEEETAAATLILGILDRAGIAYSIQEFTTEIPSYKSCSLVADGEPLEVLPSGLISGVVVNNHTVLSSLISSQKNLYDANINFNPASPYISRSNHYFAPAFSIARTDVEKVVIANTIRGELEVVKTAHQSKNILVGNGKNPTTIIFSHYDSIATGAVDNGSGTALSLELVTENPDLLGSVLFVLCGNEELSYDEPIYWGHGYRCFEKEYRELLTNTPQILVLDSFGHTLPIVFSDPRVLTLAFPIVGIETYAEKTSVIAGDIDALMEFYHAENDVPDKIKPEYFEAAKKLVLSKLGS
jgi:hypothetical protein